MDNQAIAQNLEALMKQVAMLQSYTELKNGQDFQNYCQHWMESQSGVQDNLFLHNPANVGVKRKLADSEAGNEIPGTSNSSNPSQDKTSGNKRPRTEDHGGPPHSDSDPHRHREHGISYKLTAQGEKLVYESNEYCRLKIKGQQVWRCALKKRKQGRCPARLVQAPDGSVISVEEHVHPTDQYVKGPNLNIESGLRICSKSEVEDSDVSDGDKNVTTEKSSSNILSKVGVGLESVHNEGASVNNEQSLHKQDSTHSSKAGNGNITLPSNQINPKLVTRRHLEHGVSYMAMPGNREKLVYNSHVYRLEKDDGIRYWSCDCWKLQHGGCKAKLVQGPDGSVFSVEEHFHPKADLVISKKSGNPVYKFGIGINAGRNLLMGGQPRFRSVPEEKDSDSCNNENNNVVNAESQNQMSNMDIDLQTERSSGPEENANFNKDTDVDIKMKTEPIDAKLKTEPAE